MRAMLLGAGGMLGHDLAATVPPAVTLLPYTKAQLDITDAKALATTVATAKPDLIINAAAYTAVDRAETEQDLAFRVNAQAVGTLGRIAHSSGARVIHLSTDYVFDGEAHEPYTEESPTNPVNAYGASKLAGERALQHAGTDSLIIRTQWLFGTRGKSFPRTMWERARASLATKVVADQTGRPTYAHDLAKALWSLAEQGARGVMHVTNAGHATWFDLASHVFSRLGRSDLLTRCQTVDYPTAAKRPRYSVLATTRVEQRLSGKLPEWREAVDSFLRVVA